MLRVPGLGRTGRHALQGTQGHLARRTARRPAKPTRSANSRASAPRPKSRSSPACNSPPRPTSGSCGPRPTNSSQEILATSAAATAVEQIEAAGSYRRGRETVGDLDFLAVASDAAVVMDHMAAYAAWPRCSPAARRNSPPGCGAACMSISASCRPSRSARRCSTSPARRPTTSSSAGWPRTAA